jgi:acetyl esterase/lipase
MAVPIGGVLFACLAFLAVKPIRRPHSLATASFLCTSTPNELPFLFVAVVVVSTAPSLLDGDVEVTGDAVSLALALATIAAFAVVTWRSLRARPVLDRALDEGLGSEWSRRTEPSACEPSRCPTSWRRILFAPWPLRPRDVERVRDVRYGDHGVDNLLDVFRHRSRPEHSPTLVYLHGGRFRWGRKNFEARAVVHRLARRGWTCISANYTRTPTPAAGFPAHLIDVKHVIAWSRAHAAEHGIDPECIFVAGSSAGAHLSAMALLTENAPAFQPGFESADTSIAGAIGLYGYYGALGDTASLPSAPLAYAHPDVAPCFVVHGDNDTYTPVEGARAFVEGLRRVSKQPVVYAELPGAQHGFDLFHSIRFEATVDAIEAFTAWVRSQRRAVRS